MLLVLKNTMAVIAPLLVGLLAGILVGTGMAQFTAQGLAESSWVMRFQLEDQLFAKAMPPLMLTTLISLLALFTLSRGPARWWLGASIVFVLLVLAITIGFEVPLNRQIQSWKPGAAPSDGNEFVTFGYRDTFCEQWPDCLPLSALSHRERTKGLAL